MQTPATRNPGVGFHPTGFSPQRHRGHGGLLTTKGTKRGGSAGVSGIVHFFSTREARKPGGKESGRSPFLGSCLPASSHPVETTPAVGGRRCSCRSVLGREPGAARGLGPNRRCAGKSAPTVTPIPCASASLREIPSPSSNGTKRGIYRLPTGAGFWSTREARKPGQKRGVVTPSWFPGFPRSPNGFPPPVEGAARLGARNHLPRRRRGLLSTNDTRAGSA